jgi:hypothetical protein
MAKGSARPKVASEKKSMLGQILELSGAEPQKEGESALDFYVRLCQRISEVDDTVYENWPDGVKDWVGQAIEAVNKKTEVPPLEGVTDVVPEAEAEEEMAAEEGAEVEEEVAEVAPPKKPGRPSVKAAPQPSTAAGKAPKAPRAAATPRGPGGSAQFRNLVVENWPISFEEAQRRATTAGVTIADTQMRRMYQMTAPVLEHAEGLGRLKTLKAA